MKLENAIRKRKLLEDQRYTCLRVSAHAKKDYKVPRGSFYRYLLRCWVLTTWVLFAGIIVFCLVASSTTWIGVVTCSALCLWSIVLRLMESKMVTPSLSVETNVTNPDSPDAVFILGRGASAIVLEGSRVDIKHWTSCGLVYRDSLFSCIPAEYCQWFTRVGTMALVLFVFSTLPNGSTMDQIAFIAFNILGQLNTLIGLRLNALCCLSRLDNVETQLNVQTRTDIYGMLIRRFSHTIDQAWVGKAGLTPDTPIWTKWREEVIRKPHQNPKQIYNELCNSDRVVCTGKLP